MPHYAKITTVHDITYYIRKELIAELFYIDRSASGLVPQVRIWIIGQYETGDVPEPGAQKFIDYPIKDVSVFDAFLAELNDVN